jgi:sterol 3beta-glucosyltransferase
MTITIITVGSRGDVQPYLALALRLQAKGYPVKLAAPTNFETFITQRGVLYAPLRADYYQLMDSPEGRALKSGNPIQVIQKMSTVVFPLMRRLMDDAWVAAQGADAIIYHPKILVGPHLAEALKIPVMAAIAVPILTPTTAFPAVGVLNRDMGGFLNKLSYRAIDAATSGFGGSIREWRTQTAGISPHSTRVRGNMLDGQPVPVLYFYSPAVVPVPHDWSKTAHVTGYWWLDRDADWTPPRALQDFLNAGEPPVYIGFGSMVSRNTERLTQAVIEGVRQSGVRAVLASGWGGLKSQNVPPEVHLLEDAPHDWLFPRMSAVVHHGGAGTTGAGLRAGKPTLVLPFLADQPFWGKRIHTLGVGPEPIPAEKLTANQLAAALRTVTTDATMQRQAKDLGERIRAEDGLGNAVQIIRQMVSSPERVLV